MDAEPRRHRLVALLARYGQLEIVGADVADHRALRPIIAQDPGVVVMAPRAEETPKAAWLARRVHERLPDCAIVAAIGDGPGQRLADQLGSGRSLRVDAPITDLMEATLHAAHAHGGGKRPRG